MIRRKIMLVLSVIVVLTLVVTLIACSSVDKAQESKAAKESSVPAQTQTVLVTTVVSQQLNRQVNLPGELQAYQDVAIYPKIQGFVEWIGVDRGSVVKSGQLLIRMSAPELNAQLNEAEAKAKAAQSQRIEAEIKIEGIRAQRLEAEAKLSSDETTYKRLKAASATPGVVAGNDVDIAEKTVEADRARVKLWEENEKAAQVQVKSLEENEKAVRQAAFSVRDIGSYLQIAAPFEGVITERNVHKGSLVGPSGGPASTPMVRIQQISRLRLIVPVPEMDVAGIAPGTGVNFAVPAFPGETFSGVVQRIGHSIDPKTRTMPVELDIANSSGRLSPGMFPDVIWPVRRPQPSLFVPPSAVATTTERTFVIRVRDGVTEWVDVKRGEPAGELIEVFGNLTEGDQVAMRGTDELRPSTQVNTKQAPH